MFEVTGGGRRASGRHRRRVLVPERLVVVRPGVVAGVGQVAAWPFLRHDRHAYNVGVAVLGLLFLLYLGYFVVNRRRHARLRRAGSAPQQPVDDGA